METFLRNNYLTGAIYKTELFKRYNFFLLDILHKNTKFYWYYPHLWWDSILALSHDYYQDSVFLCREGESVTAKIQKKQRKKWTLHQEICSNFLNMLNTKPGYSNTLGLNLIKLFEFF